MDNPRRPNVSKEFDDVAAFPKIALVTGHEHSVRAQWAKRVSQ
jgi:hypothetical protein